MNLLQILLEIKKRKSKKAKEYASKDKFAIYTELQKELGIDFLEASYFLQLKHRASRQLHKNGELILPYEVIEDKYIDIIVYLLNELEHLKNKSNDNKRILRET